MKKLFVFCVIVITILTACQPSQSAIETAIAQTKAAEPTSTSTKTIIPTSTSTSTSIPPTETQIPVPTNTNTPETSPEELRENFKEGVESLITVMGGDDLSAINMIKLEENVFEIELKTKWASQDRQPDVSYVIIQLISTFASTWSDPENVFLTILPDGFNVHLVTYSTDGDYRYESFTDFKTLQAINEKTISYNEWVTASNAGFK